jgi:dihydrodipicolinate synthase/N-acetylneuraminate lyase
MLQAPFSAAQLRESVIAVPPLARDNALNVCPTQNEKIIRYLEAGGIRSLLYGGNAVFYHARMSEYAGLLAMLADKAGDETVVIPSIGPAYGLSLDQVDVLRDFEFSTVMLLPSRDVVDQVGIATAVRHLSERLAKPIVLYLKFDRWLDPALIESLEADGVVSWIKYAVVRDDPSQDDYLREVLEIFPRERVVSGIGEQPAIVHLRDFGVAGFTSGCVCVAPDRSMQMMRAIHAGDYETAEAIREWFRPLEDLRNEIHPIRVLHHALAAAEIAQTGPMLPMLSDLPPEAMDRIKTAVTTMMSTA